MPYFPASIPPIALYDGELGQTASAVPGAANSVFFVGVTLQQTMVASAMRCRFATGGAGHYDLGIYDATGANDGPGNLIAHCASSGTALATATGNQSPTLIGGPITLSPGRYWLALWIDNNTDTITKQTGNASLVVNQNATFAAGPLPANASSVTGLGDAALKPLIIVLKNGGWS